MSNKTYKDFNNFLDTPGNPKKLFFVLIPVYSLGIIARRSMHFEDYIREVLAISLLSQLIISPLIFAISISLPQIATLKKIFPHTNLATFSITGLILSLTLMNLDELLLGDNGFPKSRLITGLLMYPFIAFCIVIILVTFQKITTNTNYLNSQLQKSGEEIGHLTKELQVRADELQVRLSKKIYPALQRLQSELNAISTDWSARGVAQLIHSIEDVSTRVIKVASNELYSDNRRLVRPPSGFTQRFVQNCKLLQQTLSFMKTPSVLPLAGSFFLLPFFATSSCNQVNASLIAVLIVQLLLLKQFEKRLFRKFKYVGITASISLLLSYIAIISVANSSVGGICAAETNSFLQLWAGFAIFIVLLSSSLYALFVESTLLNEERLMRELELSKSEIAEKRLLLNKNAEEFVQIFHGDIQSGLSAISMALQIHLYNPDEELNHTEIANLQDQIAVRLSLIESRLNDLLLSRVKDRLSFIESLGELKDLWSGLLEITIQIDSTSSVILEVDDAFNHFVIDMLHEIATNSIRHGASKFLSGEISVVANRRASQSLNLVFINDGKGLTNGRRQTGLMTARILRMGGKVSMQSHLPTGVLTHIRIPVQKAKT